MECSPSLIIFIERSVTVFAHDWLQPLFCWRSVLSVPAVSQRSKEAFKRQLHIVELRLACWRLVRQPFVKGGTIYIGDSAAYRSQIGQIITWNLSAAF